MTCSDSKESISSSGLSRRMNTYMYVEGREGWRGQGRIEMDGEGREGWRRKGGREEGREEKERKKEGKGRRKRGSDSKGIKNCAGTVMVVSMETDQIKSRQQSTVHSAE